MSSQNLDTVYVSNWQSLDDVFRCHDLLQGRDVYCAFNFFKYDESYILKHMIKRGINSITFKNKITFCRESTKPVLSANDDDHGVITLVVEG